jgi:hypothetical protein
MTYKSAWNSRVPEGKLPTDYQIVRGLATGAFCAGLLLMAFRPLVVSRLEDEVQTIRTQATLVQETKTSKKYNQIANNLQEKADNLNQTMRACTIPTIGISLLGLAYLRGRKKTDMI